MRVPGFLTGLFKCIEHLSTSCAMCLLCAICAGAVFAVVLVTEVNPRTNYASVSVRAFAELAIKACAYAVQVLNTRRQWWQRNTAVAAAAAATARDSLAKTAKRPSVTFLAWPVRPLVCVVDAPSGPAAR